MGLKQIKDSDRIIFLKEFTKQLISKFVEEEKTKEGIEIEKLRMKFANPQDYSNQVFKKIIRGQQLEYSEPEPKKFIPSRYSLAQKQLLNRKIPLIENIPKFKPARVLKPFSPQRKMPQKQQPVPIMPSTQETQITKTSGISQDSLSKIEPLIRDQSILLIECPGPGKNILVKRYNQINVTKITLNQPEINNIIKDFSDKARIPIVGGILKAAVGNTVISAVVSEFAGSRFIINKITPYSLIHRT